MSNASLLQMYDEAAVGALSPSTQEAAATEAAEAAAEDADPASAGSGTPRAKTPRAETFGVSPSQRSRKMRKVLEFPQCA
jgi:hypothetical protein